MRRLFPTEKNDEKKARSSLTASVPIYAHHLTLCQRPKCRLRIKHQKIMRVGINSSSKIRQGSVKSKRFVT